MWSKITPNYKFTISYSNVDNFLIFIEERCIYLGKSLTSEQGAVETNMLLGFI